MIRKELLNAGIEELEEQAGIVANIERYAINDGNGVRTTVFLKGCQLRCRWCSNPETQAFFPEMSFFPDKCIACRNCQKLCPVQALDEQLVADRKLCRDCYKRDQAFACTKQCYTKCRKITGEHMSAHQVYEEVRRDVQFYEASGGGVTLSGGEPMAQPDFAYAMLRIFTERWIDTAIETCGFAEKEDYIQTVPYLNTIFMDIKQMDPQKHKEWTGQSNEKILENVKCVDRLAGQYGNRFFIRIPIIPGFNDQPEDVEATAKFVSSLKNVTGMELLPYHKLGRGKYYSLGRPYPLEELEPPTDEKMQELHAVLARYDIPIYQF